MLDRAQKRRPKRKGTPVTSPKRLAKVADMRKCTARQALELVAVAKVNDIELTAGEAMRMLEQHARQRKNPPASPITGSMERMQKHITAPRGWIVYGNTTGRVIPT